MRLAIGCAIIVASWLTNPVSVGLASDESAPSNAGGKTAMGWAGPMSDREAWQTMPPALSGSGQPLPAWARVLARSMPRTAASFLQLDYAHRVLGPVDPKLRAAMRWISASENGCKYALATAEADALRAGESHARLASLKDGSFKGWSAAESSALKFARAMTVDSDGYTDQEFARLVEHFSANQAACMVLHLAYSNFQDRLLNCLGVSVEDELDRRPLPPAKVAFDLKVLTPAPSAALSPPPQRPAEPSKAPSNHAVGNVVKHDRQFTWLSYDELQQRLVQQRKRQPRLPAPNWSEIAPKLPAGLMDKPSDIIWYQLSLGYAHELAVPFEIYLRASGGEILRNWDRVFGGSLFWMVTDAVKCPYCMGHCEMNWEVAGLNAQQIAQRSKILAGSDWSSFTPAEQHALAFARKLTLAPSTVTREDFDLLRSGLGDERALYTALNASRYNYMTRISNGFQLTLESDNVFWSYYNLPRPTGK